MKNITALLKHFRLWVMEIYEALLHAFVSRELKVYLTRMFTCRRRLASECTVLQLQTCYAHNSTYRFITITVTCFAHSTYTTVIVTCYVYTLSCACTRLTDRCNPRRSHSRTARPSRRCRYHRTPAYVRRSSCACRAARSPRRQSPATQQSITCIHHGVYHL